MDRIWKVELELVRGSSVTIQAPDQWTAILRAKRICHEDDDTQVDLDIDDEVKVLAVYQVYPKV